MEAEGEKGKGGFPEGMDAAFCGMYYGRMEEARWGVVEGKRHVGMLVSQILGRFYACTCTPGDFPRGGFADGAGES